MFPIVTSFCFIMTNFEKDIKGRSTFRYILGLLARWKLYFKYDRAVRIARKRWVTFGENVVMRLSQAIAANSKLKIRCNVSMLTDKIGLRNPETIFLKSDLKLQG